MSTKLKSTGTDNSHQFLNYDQSTALYKLGFREKCFMYYDDAKKLQNCPQWVDKSDLYPGHIPAPLWQQAFDFFEDHFQIIGDVKPYENAMLTIAEIQYRYFILTVREFSRPGKKTYLHLGSGFNERLEAKNECIDACIKTATKEVEYNKLKFSKCSNNILDRLSESFSKNK